MNYQAPIGDFEFIFKNILPFESLLSSEKFSHCDIDTVKDMLNHASKFKVCSVPHYEKSDAHHIRF